MLRWVTEFINTHQEEWDKKKKDQEEKINKELEDWNKSKRFEKIRKLKEKWKKDKTELEPKLAQQIRTSPDLNIWRKKRNEEVGFDTTSENLENLVSIENGEENTIAVVPIIRTPRIKLRKPEKQDLSRVVPS